jgi:MOSC domain-containing protein YiiM
MGTVERIHVIADHGGPPRAVEAVLADAGQGLRGDRHHGEEAGDLTLIEAEALEQLASTSGLDLTGGQSRRNLVTRGIDLGQLVGRRFRVGEVVCEGEERCEPCQHLASLTGPPVLRGLVHTGLRASIVESGTIHVGDVVGAIDP